MTTVTETFGGTSVGGSRARLPHAMYFDDCTTVLTEKLDLTSVGGVGTSRRRLFSGFTEDDTSAQTGEVMGPFSLEDANVGTWTAPQQPNCGGDRIVEAVVRLGKGEVFEDGIDTPFSIAVESAVRHSGKTFLDAFYTMLVAGRIDPFIAAEALRRIGAIDDQPTADLRWVLLVECLHCPDLILRDGALMGLAAMNTRSTLPYLRRALQQPGNEPLRNDIEAMIRLCS